MVKTTKKTASLADLKQEVAAAEACVGDARAVAIFAGDFGDFGVSQQHAGCRNFCAYHQALG